MDPSKALADALNDAKKKAGTSRGTKEKGGKSSVAGALADFQKSAGGAGGGGGGEGDGPGGGGLNDVYMGQVMLAVRPNWSFTSATRLNLVCVVRVKVNLQGEVEKVDVRQSSGNAQYDSSAANAIWRTSRAGAFPATIIASRRRRRNSTPSWTLSSHSTNSWAASRSVKAVVPGGAAALLSWRSRIAGDGPAFPKDAPFWNGIAA